MSEVAVPCDFAEADDDADFGEGGNLCRQVRRAVANLVRGGLVAGRSTADDGADPEFAKPEPIVTADGNGLAGQAEFVENGVHEVTRAVASEGTAGAVGSVGPWGEAENENAGVGISEAGNGFGPVLLIAVRLAGVLADATAVVDQPGAAGAGRDTVLELVEQRRDLNFVRPLVSHSGLFLGTA